MASFTSILTLLLVFVTRVFGILPVTGATGGTYPRYDIRTLQASFPRQWSLYIQAMQVFQNISTSDVGSYYQIGGIHGLPNVPYDGVAQTANGVGYCTHSCNLFPTWHRPYVALFEQQMVAQARTIAQTYPTNIRSAWITAANQLRMPYWDWARVPPSGTNTMPTILTSTTVNIQLATGYADVYNPLYSYKFPNSVPGFSPPWSTWPYTLRWPSSSAQNAYSQNNLAVSAIQNQAGNIRSNVYQWFTNCPQYLQMSNDLNSTSTAGCPISLESVHNNIHVLTGGTVSPQGHMTIVPYSGFEPLFMLHHCQIDRLFAMWQLIYPNSYTTAQASNVTTFTISKGQILDQNTDLKPFHSGSSGIFWNSATVRNTTVFNYIYDDMLNGNNNAASMQARVNSLYGPSATAPPTKTKKRRHERKHHAHNTLERRVHIPKGLKAANGSIFEYNANIETSRFGLGGSYSIFVFFSDPTDASPASWPFDPKLVGSYGVFSAPGMEGTDIITSSTVPLSLALASKLEDGTLEDLSLENVIPFLKKNIQWHIAGPDGSEVAPENVPDLRISVVSSTLMPSVSEDEFPVWSKFYTLRQITKGKPGGL